MQMNTQLSDALNKQVNMELAASHNYLAIAAYFDAQGLGGFAKWFRAQSVEETEHGMRLYKYLTTREERVNLDAIAQPKSEFQSPVAALSAALDMEKGVTESINALYLLSQDVKDPATQTMLSWFVDEQLEEEETFRDLIDQAEAAEGDRWNLLALDKQMHHRAAA